MRKGTGCTLWPLTSPDASPTFAAGGRARFDLNDVPAVSPSGPLANYIPALILTFLGALISAAETPDPVSMYDLPGLLIKSIQLQNCWHGTPISSEYWLGENLRIQEYVGNGYQLGQRASGLVTPSATAGTPARFSVRIPLCKGSLERDTAQLAALYSSGSLIVVMNDATVLDGASTGTTWAGEVTCSAELDPRPEIVLGTAIEWVLHRQVASTNGFPVQIKGFGRSSLLTGVQEKGGVLSLMELTSIGNPSHNGVFIAPNVTGYGFDWRGQVFTNNVRDVLNSLVGMVPDRMPGIPQTTGDDTSASNERTVFPYYNEGALGDGDPLVALMCWPMVLAGDNVRLTDLETAQRDETYRLEVAGGFGSGDHLTLAEYAKPWQDGKIAQFKSKVLDGGPSSIAAHVLGDRYESAVMRQRTPFDKHSLTADELTYLAYQFDVPQAA